MAESEGAVASPAAVPITTGRWSAEEHLAFQDGLKQFGANWRAIQRLVPTRTLIQIRTHAQKYFNKLGIDSGSQAAPRTSDEELIAPQSFEAPSAGQAVVAAGVRLQPFATLRHVLLEPVHPTDTLGLRLGGSITGGVTIDAFLPILTSAPLAGPSPVTAEITGPGVSRPVAIGPQPVVIGAAEESDLVRLGDVIVGVSGVATLGLDPPQVMRAISSARHVTPGGVLVLHLCSVPVPMALVEEATFQCAGAAAQLLGSAQAAETAQQAIFGALTPSPSWPFYGGGPAPPAAAAAAPAAGNPPPAAAGPAQTPAPPQAAAAATSAQADEEMQ